MHRKHKESRVTKLEQIGKIEVKKWSLKYSTNEIMSKLSG